MLIAALISLSVYLLERWALPIFIWPDSSRYLRMALGQPVPHPFHRRWLLPTLCGTSLTRWVIAQALAFALLGALAAYAVPAHPYAAAWLVSIPLVYMSAHGPILVDVPSTALAWASALAMPTHPALSVALALLSGACKESGPVLAAAYSLSPLPLLGLAAARWLGGASPQSPHHGHLPALQRPDWRSPQLLLALGTLPVLALSSGLPLTPALPALAVCLGMLCIATDRARLMAMSAPALVPFACAAPPWLLALGVALHILTPRSW